MALAGICCWAMMMGCGSRYTTSSAPLIFDNSVDADFNCYYVLNEKYLADQQARETGEKSWFADVSLAAFRGGLVDMRSLFDHNGGGPHGAEWNSDGDIYFVGSISIDRSLISQLHVYVNGKEMNSRLEYFAEKGKDVTVVGLRIPGEEWQALLRPPMNSEWGNFLDLETILQYAGNPNQKLEGISYLGFELRIRADMMSSRYYYGFGWAGGE